MKNNKNEEESFGDYLCKKLNKDKNFNDREKKNNKIMEKWKKYIYFCIQQLS